MFKKQCIFINNCLIYLVATECTHTLNGKEYTGTVSHTKTGKPCQRWDSQTPHKHDYNHLSKDENYCRNTDGSAGPWCYTMDPDIRWELCDVPKCGKHFYNWSLHKFIHTLNKGDWYAFGRFEIHWNISCFPLGFFPLLFSFIFKNDLLPIKSQFVHYSGKIYIVEQICTW